MKLLIAGIKQRGTPHRRFIPVKASENIKYFKRIRLFVQFVFAAALIFLVAKPVFSEGTSGTDKTLIRDFQEAGRETKDAFRTMKKNVNEDVKETGKQIKDGVKDAAHDAKETAKETGEKIKEEAMEARDSISGKAKSAWTNVRTSFKKAWNKILDAVRFD